MCNIIINYEVIPYKIQSSARVNQNDSIVSRLCDQVNIEVLSRSPVVVIKYSLHVFILDISNVWFRTVLENSCITGTLKPSAGLAALQFFVFVGYATPHSNPKSCLKYGIPIWKVSIWLVPNRTIICIILFCIDTDKNAALTIFKNSIHHTTLSINGQQKLKN